MMVVVIPFQLFVYEDFLHKVFFNTVLAANIIKTLFMFYFLIE